jgi:hypothetical protein
MLEAVKLALRITAQAYDQELELLIQAALDDLGIAGVASDLTDAPLIRRAVITYCRLHFGSPPDYDRLKASYDEQKAQLQMATGYNGEG